MGMYRFFIIFLITYAHVTFGDPTKNNTETSQYTLCTTDECIRAASEILANLNRSVDPCDDFYKFACGGWIQNNRANLSLPYVDSISPIRINTEKHLRAILEGPVKPGDTKSLQKAKHVYVQCMNNENGATNGRSNFSEILNKYAEWQLILPHSEWEDRNLTWQNVSAILHKNKFDNGLYILKISVNEQMSNSNVIFISDPYFYLPRYDMIQLNSMPTEKENYISAIVSIARNLIEEIGGNVEIENLTRDALDIVHFEIELAKLTMNCPENDVPLTIQEFQEKYDKQHPGKKGKIDWHSTIQEVFASEGIVIEPSETVVILAYTYLTNLGPLLERTPSRTIANYMVWNLIRRFNQYIRSPKVNGDTERANNTEDDTTWKKCIEEANFKSAISHEYIKTHISYDNLQHIGEINTDIVNVVREQIRKAAWMDEPTRLASLEKLENMRYYFIGPEWYSNEAIDKYYEDLNISTKYLDNVINIFKFERKKMFNSLRTPVDKKKWLMEPTTPEGYYSHDTNTLAITATLLQNPVYNRNRLPLMNYASLGFLIAHEISHGFDRKGRMHDKDGNKVQFWTQKSIDEYANVTQCFIDQYNEYLVPKFENEGIHVNGQLTLGTNIADSAGIAAAYYAYKNRKARLNESEWRLQGLEEYSDDQIFFMTFAHSWCEDGLPEQIMVYLSDEHPLKEIRISGSLSNLREFSDVYKCSAGKRMNPEKKCALW